MATEVSVRFEDEDDESSRSRETSPKPAPTKGRAVGVSGQSERATELTRDELVFEAKQLGVTGYSRMNKTQLQNAINEKLTPKKKTRTKKPKAPVVEDTDFDPVKLEIELQLKESARNKAKKILKSKKQDELKTPKVEPQPTSTQPIKKLSDTDVIVSKDVSLFHGTTKLPSESILKEGVIKPSSEARTGTRDEVGLTWWSSDKSIAEYYRTGGGIADENEDATPGEIFNTIPGKELRLLNRESHILTEEQANILAKYNGVRQNYDPIEAGMKFDRAIGKILQNSGLNTPFMAEVLSQFGYDGLSYARGTQYGLVGEIKLNNPTPKEFIPVTEPQPTSTPTTEPAFEIQPQHEPDLFKYASTQSGSGAGNTPPPPGPTTGDEPEPDDEGDEEYPPDVLTIPPGSQIATSATPENPEPTQKTFVKSALKTKERLEKERSMNDALAIGQMKRRALLQTSIQKRRETLRRRREREAITERTREAKSQIKEQFDRGESDRLIRRLATFGIGRAVGIDGGIITALAEILLFQPEISKAEKEIDSLTKQVDRSAKEEFQELERSKLATSERRLVQSLDIQELIENTKMQAAINEEPVDIDALESQIQEILTRGVVDPGTGIPQPLTGQKPGPATEVFPQTNEYTTPAESGSVPPPSGTPVSGPPPSSGGSGGSIPPVGSFGGSGGSFGGFGGGQSGGTGGPGGSGGPGGLIPAMTSTTTGLLQLTVALTALTGASKVVTEGFATVGRIMENPQDPQNALQAGGATIKAGTTAIAGLTGLIASSGNPLGALSGVVVGKAIGAVIIDPIVEAINVGTGAISSVAKESLAPQTVQAKAEENVNLLIRKIEDSFKLDDITSQFVEVRTGLTNSILDLKNAFIQAIGPSVISIAETLTKILEVINIIREFSSKNIMPEGFMNMVNFFQEYPTVFHFIRGMAESLFSIASSSEETARNTNKNGSNLIQSINDFFMGKLSPEESMQGSFGASNSAWAINQNMATI